MKLSFARRKSPDRLARDLEKRLSGSLYPEGPRWLRRWRVSRFDRRLAAADQEALLRDPRA
ncbi:MAG TPA: hypothetical protein VFX35_12005 [Solirubrobacterales bacterium]|nr:hypothetical protein [Solirubrobacterales bacterium]